MFTSELTQLYQRLENYQLDDPTHEFGFTRHLIKNHGWTEKYATRAIAEYKKFAFLTVVADHQIVPSDAVDGVWHAHILLTKSYWDEFCPQILEKKLHHHPARGGKQERTEFHQLYLQTIASYRQYFGNPPQDIWSPPDIRFGKELKMQRVSKVDNWIISKYLLRWLFSKIGLVARVIALIALILVFVTIDSAYANSPNKIENSLSIINSYLYSSLPIISVLILRYQIRKPSKQESQPQLNLYQTAYLAGGSRRAVELVIVKLVREGYLRPNVRNRTFAIAKALDIKADDLEHQVMSQIRHNPEFKKLIKVNEYKVDDLRIQLEREKLLVEQNFLLVINYAIIFLFILLKVNWFVCSIAFACSIFPGSRTRWGDRVLIDIIRNHNSFDPIQRFALYGKETLSGGALDDLKQIYKAQQEEDAGGCGCGC